MRLEHLEIDSYILKDHKTFHRALVHQQANLVELTLNGETEGMFRDDLDILVDSLKQLKSLQRLSLTLLEVLRDEHIMTIFQDLKQLETIYVTGLELNDDILPTFGGLPNLRDVTLSGISKFSKDGLDEFISMLGPGNQGIRVTIDQADPETALSDKEQTMLAEHLAQHVGGTFDYTLYRGLLIPIIHPDTQSKADFREQIHISRNLKVTRTECTSGHSQTFYVAVMAIIVSPQIDSYPTSNICGRKEVVKFANGRI
jgi:hypothetical protein